MKKNFFAIGAAAMLFAGMPLSGLSASAEQYDIQYLPEWVPRSFADAHNFYNTYGSTHIDGSLVCVVLKEDPEAKSEISEDIKTKWDDGCQRVQNEVYELKMPERPEDKNSKEYNEYEEQLWKMGLHFYSPEEADSFKAPFVYRVLVYEMMPDDELTFSLKYTISERISTSRQFKFHCENNQAIDDYEFSWVPDSVSEFRAYNKEFGTVSLHDNYIVYCGDVCWDGGYDLFMNFTGTAKTELVKSSDVQGAELVPSVGGMGHYIMIYRVLNPGTIHLSYQIKREFEPDTIDPIEEKDYYFKADSVDMINQIPPQAYKEPVKGDCNSDDVFAISDIVMLQKYLIGEGDLSIWANADWNNDNLVNAIDLSMMKHDLIPESAKKDDPTEDDKKDDKKDGKKDETKDDTKDEQKDEPKLIFKGDQQLSAYSIQENAEITVPYTFYLTIPAEYLPKGKQIKLDIALYDADTDKQINTPSPESTGKDGGFCLTVDMNISESGTRRYYAVVKLTDITNPKPEVLKELKSDPFEWTIEVYHDIPAPPAAG